MTHSLPLSRPAGIAAPALLATAALFMLMQWLIATQQASIEAAPTLQFNEITLPKPIHEIVPRQTKPVPPPEQPPPTGLRSHPVPTDGGGSTVVFKSMRFELPKNRGTRLGSGALVPGIRVPPVYPGRALTQGIEGYVDLAFTVTAAGGVADIRVIDARPSGVFDRAAVRAVAQWKYHPRMVDGRPIATRGVRTRIRFELKH